MNPEQVRWSLKIAQRGWSYEDCLRLWQAADASDWHAVFFNDHLYGSCLDPWTTLSAMFLQTSRIKGGTMVTSNTFRHPSILAKMVTTVDIISKGRLLLGLGTGREEDEHTTYGLRLPPPGELVDRLDETCHILMAAWSGRSTTFKGRYYELNDAVFAPGPARQPHPYLIIGVKGDRALGVALKYADEWNWNRGSATTDEFLRRMDKLDELCERAGRAPASLPRSLGFRRLYGEWIKAGRASWKDDVDIARRCLRRGAEHVVLMLGDPPDAEAEVRCYHEEFIPEVLAGL
jgi:alkanesulfonate monooxygenase SsuD/methylene tetrahydromethanopterin reductase-like flavin-dependent oxidoreductase (luciferase family)